MTAIVRSIDRANNSIMDPVNEIEQIKWKDVLDSFENIREAFRNRHREYMVRKEILSWKKFVRKPGVTEEILKEAWDLYGVEEVMTE